MSQNVKLIEDLEWLESSPIFSKEVKKIIVDARQEIQGQLNKDMKTRPMSMEELLEYNYDYKHIYVQEKGYSETKAAILGLHKIAGVWQIVAISGNCLYKGTDYAKTWLAYNEPIEL